jgi:hypothetical protein
LDENQVIKYPFRLVKDNASYLDSQNDKHENKRNGTKIRLGHLKRVAEGVFRGTETETDGTVPPSGYKLDVFFYWQSEG